MTGAPAIDVEVQAAGFGARPLPFVFAADMELQSEIDYLIDGYLERATVSMLYAPKDHFKSFLNLDWQLSVSAGLPWCGREVKSGLTVLITGEGHRGIDRRVAAWAIAKGVDRRQLKFARSTVPTQILNDGAMFEWVDHLRRVADHYGEAPAIVGIDTVATNYGPGSQNDPSDFSRFIANIKTHLIGEFGCAVSLVHHSGKDPERGARGASSAESDSDAVFYLEREKDAGDLVTLHCKHVKDGERPNPLALEARSVDLGIVNRHGDPITSLVLAPHKTERQLLIINQTGAGRSQRQIADYLGVDRKIVSREIRRLKLMGFWPHAKGIDDA